MGIRKYNAIRITPGGPTMNVFITGATSGIGEACAITFAAAGHNLILLARRRERLHTIGKQLTEKYGVQVNCLELDVRDRSGLAAAIQNHPHWFQNIDVLINNAGLARGLSPIQDGSPEDWDTMIDTNVKGLLYATRAILPIMIKNSSGHIINIGSVAGHWVYEKGNVYCASKYAVRALNESLRLDLAGTPIRITEISPGMVETEFSEVRYGDKEKGKAVYAGKKPLQPSDIAETVLWCTSRPAHVNIQEVVIFPTEQPGVQRSPSSR